MEPAASIGTPGDRHARYGLFHSIPEEPPSKTEQHGPARCLGDQVDGKEVW
jgi:hypothetical protein